MSEIGTVYLIHLGRPYRHARHYIGWTRSLAARVAHHRAGSGSNFLRVVTGAGIDWEVVRSWEGTRSDERRLKSRRNAPRLCPVCASERAASGAKRDVHAQPVKALAASGGTTVPPPAPATDTIPEQPAA